MESFRNELKDCTIISVGHRPNLEQFHDRTIFLQRRASGARIVPDTKVRAPRLARLLRKGLRPRPSPDSSAPSQRIG